MECFRLLFEHLAWIEHQFAEWHKTFKEGRSLWGMMRGVGGIKKSIDQSWLAKGLGLGLLCWGFKEVQEEIPSEEASTRVSRHFQQDNAPVHTSILVTDYLTKMASRQFLPSYNPDLTPYDFWLFPQLRGCRYETIEEMKEAVTKVIDTLAQEDFHGLSRSCWNSTTSALQPEEITSKGTRVSCVYYQQKCPYEKVWKLI